MALSSSSLEGKIKSKLSAAGFDLSQSPMTAHLAKAIAEAVVEEITSNAQVAGVQPGSGTVKVL
jgi:hypothetical protein